MREIAAPLTTIISRKPNQRLQSRGIERHHLRKQEVTAAHNCATLFTFPLDHKLFILFGFHPDKTVCGKKCSCADLKAGQCVSGETPHTSLDLSYNWVISLNCFFCCCCCFLGGFFRLFTTYCYCDLKQFEPSLLL